MHKNSMNVTIAYLIFASIPVRAERFSLDCTLSGNQGVLTFIIDTEKSTADNLPANIDNQKIAWNDGQWWYLINRSTGVLTSSKMTNKSGVAKANCSKSVAYKSGSNPIGELANRSADEFIATTKQCDQFPGNTPQRKLCLNKVSQAWLRERSKEYERIPKNYITGNDLARTFIEKSQ